MSADDLGQLADRLRRHLRDHTRDLGDAVTARKAGEFADPALHAAELQQLFRRGPLVVGHGGQLPEPGDFITVDFIDPPLLLVRGRDGVLRAFVNACRHRGAALETAASGRRLQLQCPYHGWRYQLDGQLGSVTDPEAFPGLEPARLGLRALPVAEVAGLIVLIATPGVPLDAPGWLAPLAAQFEALGLADHRHFRTEFIDTSFNWKIGVEGALETYHFPYVHAASAARLFDGLARVHDLWPPHLRFALGRRSLRDDHAPRSDPAALREQVLLTYLIFPNMLVSFTNDHVLLTGFFPRGVAGCRMVYTLLTPSALSTAEHAAHWERTWALTRGVLAEDFAVQETIQRACESGRDAPLLLGRYETCVAAFRQACDAALAAPTDSGR